MPSMPSTPELARRKEFLARRFGLFIHWGVYSVLAGEWNGRTVENDLGEWVMNALRIPIREYEKVAAAFHPSAFDADALVKRARDAGMRYIVITSKHHDGFALFRSECDPYNIHDWGGFKRDVIAELAEACRRHDMPLGLYYSQALDWHEEHAGGWEVKTTGLRSSWGNVWDFPDNTTKDFALYFEKKVKPQVRELLTRYGDIFLLWFDTPKTITAAQSEELYHWVKKWQPDCLINSRIGNGKGDYGSLGDNQIPVVALENPYESPVTLNNTWGYTRFDHHWKSSREIIEMLAKLASRNVNLLLNVGPKDDGSLTPETVRILDHLADWTAANGEALYGTSGNPLPTDFDWGYLTVGKDRCYLCLKKDAQQTIRIRGLRNKVLRVYGLHGGPEASFEQVRDEETGSCEITLEIPETGSFLPVFAMQVEGSPVFQDGIRLQNRTLSLYPMSAELFDGRHKTGASVFMENRYLTYDAYGKLKVDIGGILVGWSKQREYLRWDVRFIEAGRYRVEVWTSALTHGWKERPGGEVRVSVSGGSEVRSRLREDFICSENGNKSSNQQIGTLCGEISVAVPGACSVALELAKDLNEDEEEIPLVALRFIRSSETE